MSIELGLHNMRKPAMCKNIVQYYDDNVTYDK